MDFDPRTGLEVLDDEQCAELLHSSTVGRLAAVVDGRLELWPVNFAMSHGAVYLRSGEGTKMDAVGGRDVVFEVDAVSEQWQSGWSIVLHGPLAEITDQEELAEAELLPLRPWSLSGKSRWLRLDPTETGGRRIVKVGGEYTD